MANFGPEPIKGFFTAAADLSADQFLFVKLTGDNQVNVCTAITDKPIGVLYNKPDAAGKSAEVLMCGIGKVVATASIAAGALIGTTNAGKAVALVAGTDTTAYVVGTVLEGVGGANGIITASIDCAAPNRAA
jgi:hypothetical protein